ncbi:preprotein translocase subunit YajC [Halomonas sp. YLGW01]|uniref:preprotein translocase subunit YajC n=1 Tax=Halomonas sp. YLGW01 TaxID=2773308 RepID=UPI0017871680|nr:preprotein translocase subunit YajC [Halomonas sp. YLGW01]
MVWLIIVLVIGLMLSPMLWLRPNPRQRRVGRLRTAAMEAGIEVKLEEPPLHDAGKMASYRWSYPSEYPGPRFVLVREGAAGQSLKSFGDGWRWRIEPLRALPEALLTRLEGVLQALPPDAMVVESSRGALTLWWGESLDCDAFEAPRQRLTELQDQLAGRPDQPAPRKLGFREMRDETRR